MHKITLALSVVVLTVAALGVVPMTAAKKHREDGGGGGVRAADDNGNNISGGSNGPDATIDYAGKRPRYSAAVAAAEPVAAVAETAMAPEPTAVVKTVKQSSKQHNAKLLNRLGMKRVRNNGVNGSGGGGSGGGGVTNGNSGGGANHHRKRLASQSRSKYGADGGKGASDSQMFIVKLPPHAHFYDDGSAAAINQRLQQQHQQTPYKNLNTVPVGFVSNGKPAKVYHWNLPVIKHALAGGRYKGIGNDAAHQQQKQQMYQLQYGDFDLPSAAAGSKIVPRRTLYYKPRNAGKPVKKSFVNNGKPNGFYVVSGKSAATPQYHKIVKAYYGSGDD